MTRKQRRLTMIGGALLVLGIAIALVLNALRDSIVFFSTPQMVAEKHIPAGKRFRLGGLVEPGSLKQESNDQYRFTVTDGAGSVSVTYRGPLPALFKEGQGVVAEGTMGENKTFTASKILAKHDENYLPREVVDALKKSGHWHQLPPAARGEK